MMEGFNQLYESLGLRKTPEMIAEIIQRALPPDAPYREQLAPQLRFVTAGSSVRRFGWSSMPTEFRTPSPMSRQIDKVRELATLFLDAELPNSDDADVLEDFVTTFDALIGKTPGRNNFGTDRYNRAERAAKGWQLSRRRYAKLFRLSSRLEARLIRLRREEVRYRLLLVGKAALAPDLSRAHLGEHLPTAAFMAYYTARMKLRSEFTVDGQQTPFDALSAALLDVCLADPNTRWFAIAHVFPRADVLAHLTDTQKGQLLGRWFDILTEIAEWLQDAYTRTNLDLQTMIVRRGNDSSTWNLFAAAWNRARDHWVALVTALGMERLFDTMLPGKVMRLIAGDVAAWHRKMGHDVHPDTRIWAALPKPWAVLQGTASCTRAQIEAECRRHGVDPIKNGWSMPRSRTAIAAFRPTPELVHGVSVGDPYSAAFLKRARVFSGKPHRLAELLHSLAD